jgi:ribosomal protein L9
MGRSVMSREPKEIFQGDAKSFRLKRDIAFKPNPKAKEEFDRKNRERSAKTRKRKREELDADPALKEAKRLKKNKDSAD